MIKNPKFEIWKCQFGLFTDEHGIVRCMGRLSQSQLPKSTKCTILLDKSHHITSLLFRECHKRVMRGGVKSILTELRSRVWIVQGRQFVRKLLYQCVVCQKLEGRPYRVPLPLPLPESGVKEEPPSPMLEWTIMSRIERVDEKYEKSLDGDYYEKLLHGKNDEKSQEGWRKVRNLFFSTLRKALTQMIFSNFQKLEELCLLFIQTKRICMILWFICTAFENLSLCNFGDINGSLCERFVDIIF